MTINKSQVIETLKIFGLDKFKDIILKSENEKLEYGLRFCKNGAITPTNTCKGDHCSVELKDCKGKSRPIGSFHTHPTNIRGRTNFLSDDDIYQESKEKSEFACLGLIEYNIPRIKCYLPNYGIEKSIIDNRNNLRDRYNIETSEYGSRGTWDLAKLTPEKHKELRNLYLKYTLADKRLKIEASRSALRLIKEPNDGADLVIDL